MTKCFKLFIMTSMLQKKRLLILSSTLITLLIITVFFGFQHLSNDRFNLSAVSNINRKLKTIINHQEEPEFSPKPIGTGKQTGRFSHGNKVTGPKPGKVTIDPIDPKLKQIQTVTVTIKHDSPVTKALLHFHTDHKTVTKKMKLIDGTPTDGTWQVKHKYDDSYLRNYYLQFELIDEKGERFKSGLRYRP